MGDPKKNGSREARTSDVDDDPLSGWVLVHFGAPFRLLGRYIPDEPAENEEPLSAADAAAEGIPIALDPVFEYHSNIVMRPPGANGGDPIPSRQSLAVPYDYCGGDGPVYCTNVGAIVEIDELPEHVQKHYRAQIANALDSATKQRMRDLGVELPRSSGLVVRP